MRKILASLFLFTATLLPSPPWFPQQAAMTAVQKEHSRLHNSVGAAHKLTLGTADTDVAEISEPKLTPPPENPADSLGALACRSDAVVVGTPLDELSALTDDETFVFSDYAFQVYDILKNSAVAPIALKGKIIVTRRGGTIRLNGRTIRAEVRGFPAFRVGGLYLLYLKYIPATGGYQAIGDRSFELHGTQYLKHTQYQVWNEKKFPVNDAASLLSIARATSGVTCK